GERQNWFVFELHVGACGGHPGGERGGGSRHDESCHPLSSRDPHHVDSCIAIDAKKRSARYGKTAHPQRRTMPLVPGRGNSFAVAPGRPASCRGVIGPAPGGAGLTSISPSTNSVATHSRGGRRCGRYLGKRCAGWLIKSLGRWEQFWLQPGPAGQA